MVTELEKFRSKYPQYSDMDDATLASKLAEKFPDSYGDLPEKVKSETPVPAAGSEAPVPDWGRENPNLYGLYGAGKALYDQGGKPVLKALGAAGGAVAGIPGGPGLMAAGAGLGYGMVGQGLQLAEEKLSGKPELPLPERAKQAGQDVIEGTSMEAGGQLLTKGVQLAGKGIAEASKRIQKYFYESALKIPPSVPKALRDVAVEAGIKGSYVPSPKGLQRLQNDIRHLNGMIADAIDAGTKSGKGVKTSDVLKRLDDVKEFYQNVPNPTPYLQEIDDLANGVKAYHGERIPLNKAQEMKRAIYQLEKKHYGEMKGLAIESNKAIARGLKEEIVLQEPTLAKLNADDSALLNLEAVLERSVNRIRNYDVIRWGDTFMTLTGAIIGGPKGAVAGGLAKRILEDAAVKSRISFALSKAQRIKGMPTTSRVVALESAKGQMEED